MDVKSQDMKRFAIIISLMFALCSCKEAKENVSLDITGEWQIADMILTKAVQVGNEKVDIYMSFSADNTFNLWQFLGYGRYKHFAGTWELSGDILTGKYSDGSVWGNVYKVSVSDDILTMEATQNSTDIYKYTRTVIPDSIK